MKNIKNKRNKQMINEMFDKDLLSGPEPELIKKIRKVNDENIR